MNRRRSTTFLSTLAVGAIASLGVLGWDTAQVLSTGPADAATSSVHLTAEAGRTIGTAQHYLRVGPYGVVHYNTLPHCKFEDGGPKQPCTWNIPTTGKPFHLDGNGVGLSYWIDREDRTHYVWPDKMLGTPVARLPELEDALVEGDRQHWRKCWLDENRTHVACPDGYRVRVYGQRAGSRSGAW